MTKISLFHCGFAVFILWTLLFSFCSKLGESTNLGGSIIDSVDAGKTDIDKHFHGLMLDSSYFQERFSVPRPGDTGFGYHNVSSGNMFLGKANSEHSAGYIEVAFLRDSLASTRFFIGNDTLKSLKMIFACDSALQTQKFELFSVGKKEMALTPDQSHMLDTISFKARGDTSQLDTIELFDALNTASFKHLFCDSIFKACSTSTTDTLKRRDTLRFAVVSQNDGIVQLRGSCALLMSARRPGTDTTLRSKIFAASQAWYVVAEDNGIAESLKDKPVSSFASKRTAVYKYRVDSLWGSMGKQGVLLSAGFLIPNKTKDTLNVQCIVRPSVERDGTLLDSVFTKQSSIITIIDSTAAGFASVLGALQEMYNDGSKPAYVYLYVRYTNNTSVWKTVTLNMKPSFKAMITNP
jgi:hypothetical protein